ncbi:MAG: aldo/keto reductase [Proteobacteria bacterium]|nr:aldo/keto reductase [Pseudomonadota bacterium]
MIEKFPFGQTGHASTRTLFGAAALGTMSQERADRVLELLLEFGVNHIDTAAVYGDSELRLAAWLRRHRDEFFLATKTPHRGYEGAKAGIQNSLERLGVERIDLIQFHNLSDEEGWRMVHGPGGALEAAIEAREQGKVRFIGVTGHGTYVAGMHRRSLERFAYDAVLLPYNYAMLRIPEYAADFEALYALCRERGVAMQTIKSIAQRRWRDDETDPRYSWYRPIREPAALERAVEYTLSRPGLFLNTPSDATLLRPVLEAAARFGGRCDETAVAADQEALGVEPLFVRDVSDDVRPPA